MEAEEEEEEDPQLEVEVGQDLGQGLEALEDLLGQNLSLDTLEDPHGQVQNPKKVKNRKPFQH